MKSIKLPSFILIAILSTTLFSNLSIADEIRDKSEFMNQETEETRGFNFDFHNMGYTFWRGFNVDRNSIPMYTLFVSDYLDGEWALMEGPSSPGETRESNAVWRSSDQDFTYTDRYLRDLYDYEFEYENGYSNDLDPSEVTLSLKRVNAYGMVDKRERNTNNEFFLHTSYTTSVASNHKYMVTVLSKSFGFTGFHSTYLSGVRNSTTNDQEHKISQKGPNGECHNTGYILAQMPFEDNWNVSDRSDISNFYFYAVMRGIRKNNNTRLNRNQDILDVYDYDYDVWLEDQSGNKSKSFAAGEKFKVAVKASVKDGRFDCENRKGEFEVADTVVVDVIGIDRRHIDVKKFDFLSNSRWNYNGNYYEKGIYVEISDNNPVANHTSQIFALLTGVGSYMSKTSNPPNRFYPDRIMNKVYIDSIIPRTPTRTEVRINAVGGLRGYPGYNFTGQETGAPPRGIKGLIFACKSNEICSTIVNHTTIGNNPEHKSCPGSGWCDHREHYDVKSFDFPH